MPIRACAGQSTGQKDSGLTLRLRDAEPRWRRRCELDLARRDQFARVRPVPVEDCDQRLKVRSGKLGDVDRRMRRHIEIQSLDGPAKPAVGEPLRGFKPVSSSGPLVMHNREHVLGDDLAMVPDQFTHAPTETLRATTRVATLAGEKTGSGDAPKARCSSVVLSHPSVVSR
jgi:hypothetical protein